VAVNNLFASGSGVGKQLNDYIDGQLASKGAFANRNDSITARRKDLTSRQDALNVRMQVFQARYTKQFTALDSLLTQMQSTSNYLTQQLSQSTSIAKSAGK
jgi:flagellar hook-associated protein 2